MTEQQAIQMVLERANKPRTIEDSRPWWKRLLSSLRVVVKAGKSLKQPIREVSLRGRVEF